MEEQNKTNEETIVTENNTKAPAPKFQQYLTPIAVIIAGVIIAFAVRSAPNSVPTPTGGTQPQIAVNIKNVKTDNIPYYGAKNAPVTIAYWSDYQCPFCKQFETQTMPSIIKDYVDQGKVKIVFKDYEFLGPDSETAGLYGRAVWELYPDKFFAWREAMYQKQDNENGGFGNEDSVISLTKTISGIDAEKVKAKVTSDKSKYLEMLTNDRNEGTSFGISGTPGFIIGKQAIPGAVPYANFKTLIDAELKK